MEAVTVIVPTHGDLSVWGPLADRALTSARGQSVHCRVLHAHDQGVGAARNRGAREAETEWLIFLDADDELDPLYVECMLEGTGDIRQPMTLGIVDGREDNYPVLIPPHPGGYMVGNHLIIGCMVRRTLFEDVGGFDETLPVLEDWELYIRMQLFGATVGLGPGAIYRVHVRPQSRNTEANGHHTHYTNIQHRYQSAWYARGLT